MNFFSLLSSFTMSLSLFLAILALSRNRKSRLNQIFAISAILLSVWSLFMIFVYDAPSRENLENLFLLSRIFAFATISSLLFLFIEMTRRTQKNLNVIYVILIYLPFLICTILSVLYIRNWLDPVQSSLGWIIHTKPGQPVAILVTFLTAATSLSGLVFIAIWWKTAPNQSFKMMAGILFITNLIPYILTVLFVILVQFMHWKEIPAMIHNFGLIWLLGVWYVMVKYQFLDFHANIILQELMQTSSELLLITDEKARILICNHSFFEILQIPQEDVQSRYLYEYIHDEKQAFEQIKTYMANRQSFKIDTSIIDSAGNIIPVSVMATAFGTSSTQKNSFLFLIHDKREIEKLHYEINLQKEKELAIKISEIQYRNTLDAFDDILFVINSDYRIVVHNQSMERFLREKGYKGKILGEDVFLLFPQFDEVNRQEYRTVFKTGQMVTTQENHIINGQDTHFEIRKIPVINDGKTDLVLTIIHNLKNRIKLEEIQLRNDKLEALAILAGGIAHDFNNILTGVLGNISIASYKSNQPEIVSILKRAEQSAYRAKNLTSQLLTFSKGGNSQRVTMPLVESLEETTRFILSGSNIELIVDFQHERDLVEYNESQMQRVFHNLILNAKEAMPQGGKLSISTKNLTLETFNPSLSLPPGDYIMVQISDQGEGINKNILHHIFDPFFTTKHQGTGLGLSTSFSIIKKHGGMIDVESKKGEGSIFTLYLPLSLKNREAKDSDQNQPATGHGRILVMDDEEIVRNTSRVILEFLGYEVTLCENGESALQIMAEQKQRGVRFDLTLLDLTIPGGKGAKDIIDIIKKEYPHTRNILTSGYSEIDIQDEKAEKFDTTCSKPFDVQKLGDIIHGVLKDT